MSVTPLCLMLRDEKGGKGDLGRKEVVKKEGKNLMSKEREGIYWRRKRKEGNLGEGCRGK